MSPTLERKKGAASPGLAAAPSPDPAPAALRTVLARLGAALEKEDGDAVVECSGLAHRLLSRHVAAQEAPAGVFSDLEQSEPGFAGRVSRFRQEHKALLHHLARIHDLAYVNVGKAAALFEAFVALSERHGNEENALLQEYYLRDRGGEAGGG